MDVNRLKTTVEEEVTNTQAQQIEMDKTGEQFRGLHEDRKKLISQWEESIVTMRARDVQLVKLSEVYAERLVKKREKEQKLNTKQSQYDGTVAGIQQAEAVISA